jgi:hypothetical protein
MGGEKKIIIVLCPFLLTFSYFKKKEDKTMGTKKSVQISFIILLIMTILAFVYGFIAMITPEVFVARSFQLYTQQSWNDYLSAIQVLANYMSILEGMAGGNGLAASIGGLFVL